MMMNIGMLMILYSNKTREILPHGGNTIFPYCKNVRFVIYVFSPASEKHSETYRQKLRKLRAEIDSEDTDKTKAMQRPHGSNMQPRQQNDLSASTEENTCEADSGNAKG